MKDDGIINTTNISMLPHDGYQYVKNAILRHNANIMKRGVYDILNRGKSLATATAVFNILKKKFVHWSLKAMIPI